MVAKTRLGPDAYGVKRESSFAGKTPSSGGAHPVGILSRLALDGYGSRRAGSFAGKTSGTTGMFDCDIFDHAIFDNTCVAPDVGTGKAGYPVYYQGRRKRKRKLEDFPNRHLDFILDKVVSEIFGEIVDAQVSTEIKADAYEIVVPFIREEPNNTFQVDWKALQKDFQRVNHLIYLWQEEILAREIDDEDELLLLMGY